MIYPALAFRSIWILGLIIVSFAGYIGEHSFVFDLFNHFRLQYLLLSAVSLLLLAWRKRWGSALVILLPLFVNFLECSALLFPSQLHDSSFPTSVKLLFANVNQSNRDYAKLLELIRTENPDIAVLTEIDAEWNQYLTGLKSVLPYTVERPAPHKFGIVLMSKLPIVKQAIYEFDGIVFSNLIIEVTVEAAGQEVRLFAAHSAAPTSTIGFGLRNKLLGSLASRIREIDTQPTVLVGDLNITPWSGIFRDFLVQSGLRDTRVGQGVYPTWPLPYLPLLIPIDHCLSKSISVGNFRTTNNFGSDHLGIVCEVRP